MDKLPALPLRPPLLTHLVSVLVFSGPTYPRLNISPRGEKETKGKEHLE